MTFRIAVAAALVALVALVALAILGAPGDPDGPMVEPEAAPVMGPADPARRASMAERLTPGAGGPIRYLAVGGGALPASTEVSLEQDLALVAEVLPGPGLSLFAGGPDVRAVRELVAPSGQLPLRSRLGALFAPHGLRTSRFRRPQIPLAGPATSAALEGHLRAALAMSTADPLLLYVASHGQQGEAPADNHVLLWAGDSLDVRTLARLHDGAKRPLRAVVTSCYSGGFAELAFEGAQSDLGPAMVARCGLFAGTWDRTTSGCDPNPDRRAQESYAVHFLSALRGQDRDGQPLPATALDYDGDGVVGLLDAHSRATAQAVTIDIPTTTSERYLRHVARGPDGSSQGSEPREARRVLSELGDRLGLSDIDGARRRLATLGQRLDQKDAELLAAEADADVGYQRLAARLLGRYPALSDAYREDFEATLDAHGPAIEALLEDSAEARAYRQHQARLAALDEAFFALQIEESQVARYVRAHETLTLAAQLERRGGAPWTRYLSLLQCERARP